MAMDVLDKAAFDRLLNHTESNCVSFYLPTHRHGEGTRKDRIRLKNMVATAEKHLQNRGFSLKQTEEFLRPVQRMLREELFWSHLEDGLAIFLAKNIFEHYRVTVSFEQEVYVSGRFLLRPLLPVLSGNGRFHLLTLTQKKVRLFRGDRYGIEEMTVTEAPTTMEELEQYRDIENLINVHSIPYGRTANKGAIFHGHGEGVDGKQVKRAIEDFIKAVNKGIARQLAPGREPLVLAGTDYLCAVYRDVNSYPHLKTDVIGGNPELMDRRRLHEHAWNLVETDYDYDRNRRAAWFWDKIDTNHVATDPRMIVPAAYEGRLDTLFLDPHRNLWGRFHPEDGRVEIEPWYDSTNEDLLDMAVHYALANGGHVYPAEPQHMPKEIAMAAILRY